MANMVIRTTLTLDDAIALAQSGKLAETVKGTQMEGRSLNNIFHLYKKDGTPSKMARNAVTLEKRVVREIKPRYTHKKVVASNGMEYTLTLDNYGKVVSKVCNGYHSFH